MSTDTTTATRTLRRGDSGEEVSRLQRQLTLLGEYSERVDGQFGPATEAAVRQFQERNDLEADGVVGPRTWARLEELTLDGEAALESLRHAERERDGAHIDVDPPEEAPIPSSGGTFAGNGVAPYEPARAKTILLRAAEEWGNPVTEPQGAGWERIDEYIRGPRGLHWTWESQYVRNRQFAWCGAFAAFCYSDAGLKAEIRRSVMPSTYRLYEWAKSTPRMVPLDAAEPGDIVIVGPSGGKPWGAHITICELVQDDGHVATFEGNARGTGPDGSTYEGVVRQQRPHPGPGLAAATYRVMHVIRPLPEDFE